MKNLDATLIEIEGRIARARQAKDQLEDEISGGGGRSGAYEFPKEALQGYLSEAEQLLEVALEAAQLPATRLRLIEKWSSLEKSGLDDTTFHAEADYLESKPLDYLQNVILGTQIALGFHAKTWQTFELAKFESMLRNTAVLLERRSIKPANEADVRGVMHDYLGAMFAEYSTRVQIPGIIRSFKPDGGVRNLKAAVEFKYAATKEEVANALSGVFEDVSGYSGSADWVRFYSVVYQTRPFEAEERFRAEFARAGAFTWTPILVTGVGNRRKKHSSTHTE
jgi:hypothetical protein